MVIEWRLYDLLTYIMADIEDRLRHNMIALHAFIQREKSQSSYDHVTSSPVDAEAWASRAHVSLSSSSSRRRVSYSHASQPSSSCRRRISPIQTAEVPESPEVPQSLEVPQAEEAPEAPPMFGGGLLNLSLLLLYLGHYCFFTWAILLDMYGMER